MLDPRDCLGQSYTELWDFEMQTAVSNKILTPCSLRDGCPCFRGAYHPHGIPSQMTLILTKLNVSKWQHFYVCWVLKVTKSAELKTLLSEAALKQLAFHCIIMLVHMNVPASQYHYLLKDLTTSLMILEDLKYPLCGWWG